MADIVPQVSLALSGLKQEFNIIVHNLANVGTVGYKRRCNTFSRLLAAQGAGTVEAAAETADLKSVFDFTQGSIIETGRALDFALVGRGFFVVETPDGPLYTRNGMFRLNQNGQIVDSAGRIVAGEAGPITIPRSVGLSQISVSTDGSVQSGGTLIGKFRLVDFKENEKDLIGAGLNCFRAPEGLKPQTPENLVVKQGFQESSNVQLVEELADMIMVTRLYEANMQFISARRDLSKSIIDVAMS